MELLLADSDRSLTSEVRSLVLDDLLLDDNDLSLEVVVRCFSLLVEDLLLDWDRSRVPPLCFALLEDLLADRDRSREDLLRDLRRAAISESVRFVDFVSFFFGSELFILRIVPKYLDTVLSSS